MTNYINIINHSSYLKYSFIKFHMFKNLKRELIPVFQGKVPSDVSTDISKDFLLNHMISSFIESIRWWIEKDIIDSPEFISLNFIYAMKL